MSAALLAAAQHDMGGGEEVLFWILGPVMVIAAFGLLAAKKAVHAALSMALVMVSLGVVYVTQQAPFLGVVQVFVYTGAVMMLFLFVLMLIGIDSSDSLVETIKGQRAMAVLLGLGIVLVLISVLREVSYPRATGLTDVNGQGNVSALAARIFGQYVWAFEVTGALLITAAIGAMVLAHRERLTPRPSQRELAARRIKEGAVKAPLPAPGVFARHNAVDTPALLPDGTPSELSVSRVLRARGQEQPAGHAVQTVATIQAELLHPLEGRPELGQPGEPEEHGEHGGDQPAGSPGQLTEPTGPAASEPAAGRPQVVPGDARDGRQTEERR